MITQYALRNKHLTPLLLMILCTCCALTTSVHAQPVHIPDPNLRATIADELNIPHGAPITQEDMHLLTHLDIGKRGITNLTGLESATNLISLVISDGPITDLSPIAGLTQLEHLWIWSIPQLDINPLANLTNLQTLAIAACDIVNISPLTKLTRLADFNARHNRIIDISPLTHLTNLVTLRLNRNRITDVQPLAHLTQLEFLEIQHNQIGDHSPLDALALLHFIHDQRCEMPPLPLEPRLANRDYPSIVSRFGAPSGNRPELSYIQNLAHHDLVFDGPKFGLHFVETSHGFTMAGILDEAIQIHDEFFTINPNMIFLVDIRMRSHSKYAFPEDWPYWVRDSDNEPAPAWRPGTYLMNFTHPYIQDRIVQQAIAVSKCGLYDGIFFDWWVDDGPILNDYVDNAAEQRARDNILQRIRAETRPDFLIMGNTNDRIIRRTGPHINGGFMETSTPNRTVGDTVKTNLSLSRIENSLLWLEQNLRKPTINALEGQPFSAEPLDSPNNLRWMRAFTSLSLTHSDGYVLFHDDTGRGHYWYDFWDADLGRPVGAKAELYDEEIPGLYIREYTNGWAVYNHSGEARVITLPEEAQGVASGMVGAEHTLPNLDGEMYLRVKSANPADVNEDGVVNILDLILVAQAIGAEKSEPDVNGDGVINVFDLVFVAGAIGGGGAAPSAYSPDPSIISTADVERWLAGTQGLGVGDANFQRGIRFLEQLLAALTPKETALLPNYPNPFNPETWIPYRLARGTEVTITIYDTKGTLVRRLALGNQAAGYYAERGKAAYWDGRNEDGEAVASGIYIYQFRAGDYAASRRMVIVK